MHGVDWHAVRIRARGASGEKAVMYLYGGGMMTPPAPRYFDYAKKMARLTGRDVWFIYYPLADAYAIDESVKMMHAVYADMVAEYGAGRIALYGFSSGGAGCISMPLYNTPAEPLPMPSLIIAVSPGGCPADDEECQRMLALADRDIEIYAAYMPNMRSIMTKGREDVPEYMVSGAGGDYRGMPETWLFYGADEVLSVKDDLFGREFAEAGATCHIAIRDKMCHCCCIDSKFPEAKPDYDAIIELLKA